MRTKIRIENLNVWIGGNWILKNISMNIYERKVTAVIGPSGCGKTTLIRTLNRLVELSDGARITGKVMLNEKPIYRSDVDVNELRRRVGMVFQKPNPFPKSVFENVAYGLKINHRLSSDEIKKRVEEALKKAALWGEVKDKLNFPALSLSGGQQQRLCLARALVVEPEVLLMDEPCSALDPIATMKIEDLIHDLRKDYTIVIVTHNMQQAARVSDYTAFLYLGELVEFGATQDIFENPKDPRTQSYITGRFG
ncbi:MAG: phosphate ABC transporter ATP-binding protein PstB [Candidatus Hadarchaeales archaeon]